MKLYKYVGDSDVLESTKNIPGGEPILSSANVLSWLHNTNQTQEVDGLFWATYIVSKEETLYISDRRSEHVACAKGEEVLAAGEIGFGIEKGKPEILEISNQSTGYCPEPESWNTVEKVLRNTQIPFPTDFTFKVIFRLCEKCGARNIVRDSYYVCAICENELTKKWNF